MSSPLAFDSPDWVAQQSPVTKDLAIYSGTGLPTNTFVNNVDVSKFQSLTIQTGPQIGTSGAWNQISFSSLASNGAGFSRSISFPSAISTPYINNVILGRVPLDGDTLDMAVYTNDPSGVDLLVAGSQRPVDATELTMSGANNYPLLIQDSFSVPANGSSPIFWLPPTTKGYLVNFLGVVSGAIQLRMQGTSYYAGTFTPNFVAVIDSTASVNINTSVPLASTGTQCQVFNKAAASASCALRIWPLG